MTRKPGLPSRRSAPVVLLGIVAGMLHACQPRVSVGDNRDATDLGLTFVPKAEDNPIFDLAYKGARQATLALSIATGRNVTVENQAPTESTLAAQQAKVQAATTKRTRGLIVSCVDKRMSTSIDDAVSQGIPVITFDSDCPDSKRLDFLGTDNEEAGEVAADLLASAMQEQGGRRVAILSGRLGADNLTARVDAFKARLAEAYPTLELVSTAYCEETPESCKATREDQILTQYPDLDGLFVVGLWGIQAACDCERLAYCTCEDVKGNMPKWHAASKENERKLKTVAFDTHPFELELMKQGYVSALIGQKYYEWGYCTVARMFDYLTKGRAAKFDPSSYDVIHPGNMQSMLETWEGLDEVRDASAGAQPPDCPEGEP